MNTQTLDGPVFSRAEFLTLLAAVNPPDLIGIDEASLLPAEPSQHRALIERGVEELRARGFVTTRGDTHLISDELLLMAGIVGFPQLVTLLIKQTPEEGLQQFTWYFAEGFIIEHTMPAEGQYRLASLPSLDLWLDRLAVVLPAAQPESAPAYTLALPQPLLQEAQEAAQNGDSARARDLLSSAGVGDDPAQALTAAMSDPTFSGSVAVMRTTDGTITAARDLALLQGEKSAWALYQSDANALITVRTLAGDEVKEVLQAVATSV